MFWSMTTEPASERQRTVNRRAGCPGEPRNREWERLGIEAGLRLRGPMIADGIQRRGTGTAAGRRQIQRMMQFAFRRLPARCKGSRRSLPVGPPVAFLCCDEGDEGGGEGRGCGHAPPSLTDKKECLRCVVAEARKGGLKMDFKWHDIRNLKSGTYLLVKNRFGRKLEPRKAYTGAVLRDGPDCQLVLVLFGQWRGLATRSRRGEQMLHYKEKARKKRR